MVSSSFGDTHKATNKYRRQKQETNKKRSRNLEISERFVVAVADTDGALTSILPLFGTKPSEAISAKDNENTTPSSLFRFKKKFQTWNTIHSFTFFIFYFLLV